MALPSYPMFRLFRILLVTVMSFCLLSTARAQTNAVTGETAGSQQSAEELTWSRDGKTTLHFFHSHSCPHCKAAMPFIMTLPSRFPWLDLQLYEISTNTDNLRKLERAAKKFERQVAVPAFFFCNNVKLGWQDTEEGQEEFVEALEECRESQERGAKMALSEKNEVEVPFVGKLNLENMSLPVITVLIAALDAFNPCVFFVLLFLLSMLINLRSRSRMAIVGGVFVFFSGFIYFLFMAAWLNIFMFAGHLKILTISAGLVGLVAAIINIKDYFFFKKGVSLTMSDDNRSSIIKRMRGLLEKGSLPALLGGTVVLAVVSNAYELICTAGFPMIFTRVLTLHSLPAIEYYLYLALYNVVYVLPLIAIVGVFVYTMGARKLQENEGRFLKLLSGYMMLSLSALLVIAPDSLSNFGVSVLLIAVSVGLAFATHFLTRMLKTKRGS